MSGKRDKQKQKAGRTHKGQGVNWDLVWKVLASVFAFAGSLATVYDLIGKVRSDIQTFYALILPGLFIIAWVAILVQLIRKKNPYVILLLAVTVLGGVAGGISWQSYNQTQEDKVIVLVAQFDGPEETFGLHNQIMEDLREATKGYNDTTIIDGKEVVTAGKGSEYARQLGKKVKADLVIWAWYRPTENPNIIIHIENLSPTQIETLQESETYQPQATLAQLESFEVQRQLGSETGTLVTFLTSLLKFKAGDYPTAIDRFEQVLEEDDVSTFVDQGDLFFSLGYSNSELGNHQRAIEYYSKAIELEPEYIGSYLNRGNAYGNLEQFERAIDDYNKAIELDPSYADAYLNRGKAYYDLHQYDHAIEDYNKTIELNPTMVVAYSNRGATYNILGQYKQAVEDGNKAIELDPKYMGGYLNRGNAYYDLHQYDHAIEDYSKAIELDPKYMGGYINRGNVFHNLQQYDRAIEDYSKAVELDPKHAGAYLNRGNAYGNLQQYERAIEDYSKAIELDPRYADAFLNRGKAYGDLEQYERAIEDYNTAIELDPNLAIAYNNRGLTYQELGKTAEAEADFKKYEELTGQKP